jgi:hypothetical protein
MYKGYLELGGVEIANVERVQKYVRNTQCGIPLTQFEEHDALHLALGQQDYVSPVADNAPWYDANTPDSADFLGLYPLGMSNVSDSTREAPVTESVRSGGTVGAGRARTREMRITGFLVGRTQVAAEMGLAWLRAIAEGASCTTTSTAASTAGDMRYFLDLPDAVGGLRLERHHYRTKVVSGPSVISERLFANGGYTITVELIITAEIPAAFTRPTAPGLLTEATAFAWAGAADGSVSNRLVNGVLADSNFVQNPGAEGATASVISTTNAAVTMVADTTVGSGTRSYRVAGSAAGRSVVAGRALERPAAAAGQRWDFRAVARLDASVYGARRIKTQLVFRSSAGTIISTNDSERLIVPEGIFHRWFAAANASPSERYEGTTKRLNRVSDPRATAATWWVGVGGTLAPTGAGLQMTPGGTTGVYYYAVPHASVATAAGNRYAMSPGQSFSLGLTVLNPTASSFWVALGCAFYSAAAGGVAPSQISGRIEVKPGETVRLEQVGTVASTSTDVTGTLPLLYVYSTAAGAIATTSNVAITRNWQFEIRQEPFITAAPFFAGDTIRTRSGVLNRFQGTPYQSASERYDSTSHRVNRAPNPINGKSLLGLGGARSDLSLVDDFVRATVNDGSAGALAQRVVIGSTAAGPNAIPVTGGEPTAMSIEMRTSTGNPMAMQVLYYDAGGTLISSSTLSTAIPASPTDFMQYRSTFTPPINAARVFMYAGTGPAQSYIGDTFDVRRLMLGPDVGGEFVDGSLVSDAVLATGQVLTPFALEAGGLAPVASFADYTISFQDDSAVPVAGDVVLLDNLILTSTSNAGQAPRYYDGSFPTTYRFGQPGGNAAAAPTASVADQPEVLWNYNADPLYLGLSFTDPKPVTPRSATGITTSREFDNTSGIEGRAFINYSRMTATAAGAVRNGWSFTTIEKAFVPTSITVAAWVRSNKAVTLTLRYVVPGGSDFAYGNFPVAANTWTKIAAPMSVSAIMNDGFTFYLELNSNLASGDTLDLALPRQSNIFDANVPLVAGSMTNDPDLYEYGYAVRRGTANSQSYGSYRRPTQRYSAAALAGRVRAPELDPTNRVSVVNLPSNDRWRRTYLSLDSQLVPKWADLIPIISVTSAADTFQSQTALSGLRIRFWPNPLRLSPADATADQTKYESELVIARLPAMTKIVLDGVSRRSSASIEGREELSANHLVFDSKGRPINWPELDCAIPYIVTIDYPSTSTNAPVYSVAALEILTSRRER